MKKLKTILCVMALMLSLTLPVQAKAETEVPEIDSSYGNDLALPAGATRKLVVKGNKISYYYNGKMVKNCWKRYQGYKYYFDPETGAALSGLQKLGANYYYFDVAGRMQTGWVRVGSRTCYFKKSTGVRRSGWFKYRGKYYYLNPKTGAKMKKRWVVYKGNYYYLDRKGVRLTGTKAVIDGKKYRFDANGICKKKTRAEAARQKAEQVTPETGNVTSKTEQVTPETKALSE